MTPTADHVAAAICAACQETGANPENVAMGVNKGTRGNPDGPIRARYYAALALRCEFVDCDDGAIGRMVGARSGANLLVAIDTQLKRKTPPHWWSDDAYLRVVMAVANVRSKPLGATVVARVKRPLGANVNDQIDGMGDRPAGRPRAEQIPVSRRDG